jgi:2-polyprenyl-3-methyl-5-hydroxy-6-metoxy-1,4-benzoquinol methylase
VLTAVVEKIDNFNAAHPWSHNEYYHRWILRKLPKHFERSLDIGCGTGDLVRKLAGRAGVASGIDNEPAVIDVARQISAAGPTVVFSAIDLRDVVEPGDYDVVTAVAVLHHLSLAGGLMKMRALLSPGGTLVIVGCYRTNSRVDRLVDAVAIPANVVMGALVSGRSLEARVAMTAPTASPQTTLNEIKAAAAQILPGACIRRRLFWRYSLIFTAPGR